MDEAYKIDFDATTANPSASFRPTGSFQVVAIGSIEAGVTFTVQQLPRQLADSSSEWQEATGTKTNFTSGADTPALVNYAYGFKYRIMRTAGTQTTNVDFYVGVLTQVDYVYARSTMSNE